MKYYIYFPIMIMGIICLLPVIHFTNYSFHDEKRLVQILFLFLSTPFFLNLLTRYKLNVNNHIKYASGLLVVLWAISSILAISPIWAFLEVGYYLLIIQVVFINVYLYEINSQKFSQIIIYGVILLVSFYLLRVYSDYLIGFFNSNLAIWPKRNSFEIIINGVVANPTSHLGFSHVRFFNHLQTWTIPVLIFGYMQYREKLIAGFKYLFLFLISSWWMLVFASDARGTLVASIISAICVILIFKNKSREYLKYYFSTFVIGLLLYIALFLITQTGARQILTRFDSTGRLDVWKLGVELILENPIFGVGPMHFSHNSYEMPWSSPHNFLIQTGAEWGLPALLILLGLVGYFIFKFLKQSKNLKNNETIITRITISASIFAAIAHSLVSGIFNTPLSQLFFTVIIAWAIGDYFRIAKINLLTPRDYSRSKPYLVLVLLSINSLFVGYKIISDAPNLNNRIERYKEKMNTNKLYPRFWNQGIIDVNNELNIINNDVNGH